MMMDIFLNRNPTPQLTVKIRKMFLMIEMNLKHIFSRPVK